MKIYAKQAKTWFLISTEGDPDTREGRGILVHTLTRTVQKIPCLQAIIRQGHWKPILKSDPGLDDLIRQVPTLRRFRGIEIRLPNGESAWISRREWSCASPVTLALLNVATRLIPVPPYTPDADHFLAAAVMASLGGEVLDPPRAPDTPELPGY